MSKTIVLTGGGTAGHVMPCLALLPHLRQHFGRICYIGTDGIEKTILKDYADVEFFEIKAVKLARGRVLKNLLIPFKLLGCIASARRVLKTINPDIVFSKGGFVALPVVYAARCPVITHESDLSPGLANRVMARRCKRILTSFDIDMKNSVRTGAPIRAELLKGSKKRITESLGFSGYRPILLVMGGSLGATALNAVVREALPELTKRYDIIHLTGRGNAVEGLNSPCYQQMEFCSNMGDVYAAASLCVSRAGAGSITELAATGVPSLLIPLPKGSSRGDQIENAAYMVKLGLFHSLDQSKLSKDSLTAAIRLLALDSSKLKAALQTYQPNGTTKIIHELLSAL